MIKCNSCGCNCDNSDTINGICTECLEEERQRQIRASAVARILSGRSYEVSAFSEMEEV